MIPQTIYMTSTGWDTLCEGTHVLMWDIFYVCVNESVNYLHNANTIFITIHQVKLTMCQWLWTKWTVIWWTNTCTVKHTFLLYCACVGTRTIMICNDSMTAQLLNNTHSFFFYYWCRNNKNRCRYNEDSKCCQFCLP